MNNMRMLSVVFATVLGGLAAMTASSEKAFAVPVLQLDIVGGTYDGSTETTVTGASTFSLLALGTPGSNVSEGELLSNTYIVSAAITPAQTQTAAFDAGSFKINGTTYSASDGNMSFGTPPLDATVNPDLGSHGIYDTYFIEIEFQFDANDSTTTYNAEDSAGGGALDESGSGTFFVAFDVDVSGLAEGFGLHFDLFNTAIVANGINAGLVGLDDFAPFSHDAEATPTKITVPEPGTLALLLIGLAGLTFAARRSPCRLLIERAKANS